MLRKAQSHGLPHTDLNIVSQEAERLQSPIPVATAALKQFLQGQAMGLTLQDDSQVVKVYEKATGVSVVAAAKPASSTKKAKIEGPNVGDLFKMEDGSFEEILEVGSEPRHNLVLSNDYVRALRVTIEPGDTTVAHRHDKDSLYFFLVPGADGAQVVNHIQGCDPVCDCMEFGEVRYGTHSSVGPPLIHKITNRSKDHTMLCIDAEVLKRPPVTAAIPLVADKHELIKTRDTCRVYRLTLTPGEAVTVTYPFFYASVIVDPGTIETEIAGPIKWSETLMRGDFAWKEPSTVTKRNKGDTTFVEYIAEWR